MASSYVQTYKRTQCLHSYLVYLFLMSKQLTERKTHTHTHSQTQTHTHTHTDTHTHRHTHTFIWYSMWLKFWKAETKGFPTVHQILCTLRQPKQVVRISNSFNAMYVKAVKSRTLQEFLMLSLSLSLVDIIKLWILFLK